MLGLLISHEIIFEVLLFPTYASSDHNTPYVTDGQTDGRLVVAIPDSL